ncbi:hypothetical protein MJO28_007348 [Puccinia striiformis f. sp. tritici]|uniref:Uncharacterized protein n=1 Tax=Puccinia striiformis f. sp. tritici TaxID=168172 RepID=A0ACC0EDT7_9BASI|nr:hypothetical protein MJO28_007348 [Puccinia striiformis f. sp. tritici]
MPMSPTGWAHHLRATQRLRFSSKASLSLQKNRKMALAQIPDVSVVESVRDSPGSLAKILGLHDRFIRAGTNTYLIAGEETSLLIDTGEGKPSYLDHLDPVLRSNPPVSDIILTHRHRDHVGGLPSVLKLLSSLHNPSTAPSSNRMPKVWKFPSDTVSYDQDIQEIIVQHFKTIISSEPSSNHHTPRDSVHELPTLNFLSEHQEFRISSNSKLQVIHTPGHTTDSISCLLFENSSTTKVRENQGGDPTKKGFESSMERASVLSGIFVGDTVLGGSSSMFEDLLIYLKTLQKLLDLISTPINNTKNNQPVRLFPGHGFVVIDAQPVIQNLIDHRHKREKQILDCFHNQSLLIHNGSRDCLTPEILVKFIYPSELPKSVYPAALHGIHQHLKKLKDEGLIDVLSTDPKSWYLIEN